MTYTMNYNNQLFEVPSYNFSIAEIIEKQEMINGSKSKFKDKCKSMYTTLCSILGETRVEELIGKFESCDPNEINILYLKLIDAYNEPLKDCQNDNISSKLENLHIDKLTSLIDALDKASRMNIK